MSDMEKLLEKAANEANQLRPVLVAGEAMRISIGRYALALAHRADGESADDEEVLLAITACVNAMAGWDATLREAMQP